MVNDPPATTPNDDPQASTGHFHAVTIEIGVGAIALDFARAQSLVVSVSLNVVVQNSLPSAVTYHVSRAADRMQKRLGESFIDF